MSSTDITNSIIIVVVFAIINIISILSIGIAQIEKNWDEYKCKPIIIPFASVFGKDTSKNFKECIQTIETSFLADILGPIYKIFNELNSLGGEIANFITMINGLGAAFRLSFLGGFGTLITKAKQTVLGVSNLGIKFTDVVGKVTGIMIVIINILKGVNVTAISVACGLPGQLVGAAGGGNPCPLEEVLTCPSLDTSDDCNAQKDSAYKNMCWWDDIAKNCEALDTSCVYINTHQPQYTDVSKSCRDAGCTWYQPTNKCTV